MSNVHPASLAISELLKDCQIKTTRRGGPGGQHRNKVDSAVVITHVPTQVVGQAGERRSQHENRDIAIVRLRLNLALAVRTEALDARSPSILWTSRRRGARISVSAEHADFPALLAEALDFIASNQFEIGPAAAQLQVSSSQLIKFIKTLPAAFGWLNQHRNQLGLGPLK